MKKEDYQVVFRATRVVVMVVFLSAVLFANSSLSFAASDKKKASTVAEPSAVAYTESHIKELEGALNITEAQSELWNNLNKVMRENAKDMDALTKSRAENTKTMNAVEHMKLHAQMTETHLNQMKKLIPPFEAFYASMSEEQKKTTDTIFRTGKPGKHKRK
jgi:hypothetical protein